MAGSSLLTLLDDIASVLKNVSVMTKVAAKKTVGVLGDDLALNAEQVTGVRANRELPVIWAVAKGSAKNKLVLVPAALLLSAFIPWLITPLLMLGGAYLCFEGFEKVFHKLFHSGEDDEERQAKTIQALSDPKVDIVAFEKDKIKGAVKTDFILSAEIIVIALGVVKESDFVTQVGVVTGIAALMTVGVYALVAAIVKLDDLGLWMLKEQGESVVAQAKALGGRVLLSVTPYFMKMLSIVGTLAMFIVGGGILVHGIPHSHELLESVSTVVKGIPVAGRILDAAVPTVANTLVGVLLGGAVFVMMTMGQKVIATSK